MNYLLDTLISLGVTGLTGEISLTLNNSVITNISNSIILRATVSKSIIDNAVIKVTTSNIDSEITDYPVITQTELSNTLTAITTGLGISKVDDTVTSASFKLPGKTNKGDRLTAISKSQIIRTTITSLLEFKDDSDNVYELDLMQNETDVLTKYDSTTKLLSIKEEEMNNLLNALVAGFGSDSETSIGGEVSFDTLKNMNEEDLDIFLDSKTVILVTDRIIRTATIQIGGINVNLYDKYKSTYGIAPSYLDIKKVYINGQESTYDAPNDREYLTKAGQKAIVDFAKTSI